VAPSSGVETKLNADAQLQTFPYPVYKKIEDFSRLSDKVVFTNFTDQRSDGETLTTRSSAIAEWPRDASCQLKSCQLPRNSAETTCMTSPEPSISCRWLTRATKSCCRQRLTICAINYSGRSSELRGIIDLVDRRRPSLSRSERLSFSSYVDNTFRRSICRGEIFF